MSPDTNAFIRLILRSADVGGGWRNVSAVVWPAVLAEQKKHPDLYELNRDDRRVRLSDEGVIVAKYL